MRNSYKCHVMRKKWWGCAFMVSLNTMNDNGIIMPPPPPTFLQYSFFLCFLAINRNGCECLNDGWQIYCQRQSLRPESVKPESQWRNFIASILSWPRQDWATYNTHSNLVSFIAVKVLREGSAYTYNITCYVSYPNVKLYISWWDKTMDKNNSRAPGNWCQTWMNVLNNL